MGNYNALTTMVKCSECGNIYEGKIQFRYGDTRQHSYHIGDKLAWGGNDVGRPGAKHVKVYGILENDLCNVCGKQCTPNEFDIDVRGDIIQSVERLSSLEDYMGNEGNFYIVSE